jgi:hypothetical protein
VRVSRTLCVRWLSARDAPPPPASRALQRRFRSTLFSPPTTRRHTTTTPEPTFRHVQRQTSCTHCSPYSILRCNHRLDTASRAFPHIGTIRFKLESCLLEPSSTPRRILVNATAHNSVAITNQPAQQTSSALARPI